ncbi:HAD superfamily hydrolase (TIGR01509 family) [Sinimarinibacterium flocculans]|uniref:HAD superfamily hydrolase (TIGR01509 family) n=2 Tax=Sinimarinibacterium flocculans TaxID=985250 RepID=A0A318E9E1_9GAMM|nr:HAD superfamily hydrolase (TIGR01509 family) [Sinimarinibacterium flocculans]
MTLRALIFDVDGTLAETEEAHRSAFNAAFVQAGLDWFWSVSLYTELLRVTGGKERIREYARRCVPEWLQLPDVDARIRALHARKTALYAAAVRAGAVQLRPGVRRLIDECHARRVRMAIATTTSEANVRELLDGCLGADPFDCIVAGDAVAAKKPAPDVYVAVLKRLDLSASACLAIEDSAAGLAAARGAGIATLVTPSAYTRDHDFNGALAVVPSLEPDIHFDVLARWHAGGTSPGAFPS